jgi:hypothetical protein
MRFSVLAKLAVGGGANLAALVLLIFRVAACGSTPAPAPSFPPYTSHEAALFDDAIEPKVLGLGYDTPQVAPRADTGIFERAQTGDTVLRGKIDSVTVRGSGGATQFELGIRIDEALGKGEPPKNLVLRVDRTSPSWGMVRALEDRLSGRPMIAFIRTYGTETAETAIHFHIVPDEPAIAGAVREALSLDRVLPDGGR